MGHVSGDSTGNHPVIPSLKAREQPELLRKFSPRFRLGPGTIQLYRFCDLLSGFLICTMVVFSPWAFGTTQAWSIWTMNVAGYCLGLLLLVKTVIRRLCGYHPPDWRGQTDAASGWFRPEVLTNILTILTAAILAFTLISALNARATWQPYAASFEYHSCLRWLPHSLDSGSTWFAFWQYLGLACSFWAVRDWLLGRAGAEELVAAQKASSPDTRHPAFPARMRLLLWLLAINGALLAIEGIIQRVEGSGNLLFLVKPRVNPGAVTQFGPYAYRSNASQYFNIVWPLCLGFWWSLHRTARQHQRRHHLLLPLAALMAACPIISTSRAGAIITVGIAVAAVLFLISAQVLFHPARAETRASRRLVLAGVLLFLVSALSLGFAMGWKTLAPRMDEIPAGYTQREEMYDRARPMASDYPLFGTGPGTFESVFQLYRISTDTYWPAQLHNDWLETRITFGWVGFSMILAALAVVLLRWFARGGIHAGRRFVVISWMALGGCLVHARWDLPFQIHSIVFLFLLVCAVLCVVSRRPA